MPNVIFIAPDGTEKTVTGAVGDTLLDLAWDNDIDIEGACEGQMACSTCHVIVAENWVHLLPPMSEEEEYMLDFAPGLTPSSRLGCQIVLTEELDGLVVRLPEETESQLS